MNNKYTPPEIFSAVFQGGYFSFFPTLPKKGNIYVSEMKPEIGAKKYIQITIGNAQAIIR